ncbi:urate oxidase, partial [Pseudohyphozyma bogoriensis]
SHIHAASIHVTKLKWSRIPVAGKPHKHSFVRNGEEKRFTSVYVNGRQGKDQLSATVTSGVQDLLVLKTTESSFENYIVDKYTTLAPVDDRIFSTAVDCSYTVNLPSKALTTESLASLPIDFEAIYRSAEVATLEVFATHNSASVQATLYKMCERILKENKEVGEVTYKLPNKHYFAVDMSYIGVNNTKPKDAEVFMPVDAPSGLIIATVGRDAKAKL